MWAVSRALCLGMLSALSAVDIRYHKVPAKMLIVGNAGAVVYQAAMRSIDLYLVFGGAGIGIIFFLISKVTEEGIGYGDSWGIMSLGIYMGMWELLKILTGTFVLLFVGSILFLSLKRMSRKCTLPFYPFLTGGYIIGLISGGIG